MKKNKNLLSLLLSIFLLIGIVSPVLAVTDLGSVQKEEVVGSFTKDDVQETKPQQTNLFVHKLVADEYNLGVPVDHNGGKLEEGQLGKLGTNVKGLDGVTFTYYKVEDAKKFKEMVNYPAAYASKEAVEEHLEAQATGTVVTKNGGVAEVALADGNYWFIETDRPTNITEAVAVPFGITLPLMNQVTVEKHAPGTVYLKNVHVYPKNLTKKVQLDKGFGKSKEGIDSSMLKVWQETYGPKYENYLNDKAKIDARIGSTVPFESKTSLKQGQIYKKLSWSDIMTDGLKYNEGSLKVTVGGEELSSSEYTVTSLANGMGFDLVIENTEAIKKINEKLEAGDVEVVLNYTAIVTKLAVVDSPESNNITFTPGEPTHKNDQNPINPSEGKISVTKSWDKNLEESKPVLITYMLIDKTTNTNVATVTLYGSANIVSKSVNEGMDIEVDGYNVTFTGLNNEHQYVVEEFANGYDPKYTAANIIENKENPNTITPTPPQVVVGGKKFVKTNGEPDRITDAITTNRLAGAEFVIKNDAGKYLKALAESKIAKEEQTVKKAKENLDQAVETYNKLPEDQQDDQAKKVVDEAQDAYNKAVKDAATAYDWGDNRDEALVLVSDAQGRFEITGLSYGNYKLEEIKAPQGFAKLESDVEFTVDENSYTKNGDIEYTIEITDGKPKYDAKEVKNKNLTIPQTGGIGTVIFTVVGIGLMAGAVIAMRRNKEEA
ncbi:pilin N-terminal domain-containing protein [Peptoniphilus sp. SGI.035]|uniref:pilin N-terminal domain-containing protein n=1 Tax=Peptoniphilus sp. SGI.035 TaxID=3420564 RepID=UPI003D02785A